MPVLWAALLMTPGCGGGGTPTQASPVVTVPYSQTDLVVGTGRQAAVGNTVTVHYTLWLYDVAGADSKGRFVESSVGGAPLTPFVVGVGRVIPGFDRGVLGMAIGGKRRLVVPPSLAYGSTGAGSIPPNTTLVFEVELLNVTD